MGLISTLFCRHSMLKAELPAAAWVTGSPNSSTVMWSKAVAKCWMSLRSGWPLSSAITAIDTAAKNAPNRNARLIIIRLLLKEPGTGQGPVPEHRLRFSFFGCRSRVKEEFSVLILEQELFL